MKRILLFTCIVLLLALAGSGQNLFKSSLHAGASSSGSFKNSIEKILKDYPNAFRNVIGEEAGTFPQYTLFESKDPVPGALKANFSRFNTRNNNVVTFDALMFRAEEFNTAQAKYKSICSELKRGIIHLDSHQPYIIDGKFEAPSEQKRFVETVYSLMPSDGTIENLRVVVAMEYVFPEWEIRVRIYDKADDTKIVTVDMDDAM